MSYQPGKRTVRIAVATLAAGAIGGSALASTSAGAATPTAVPRCGNGALLVTAAPFSGSSLTGSRVLLFRNVIRHSCTLYGYPGVAVVSGSGREVDATRRPSTHSTVLIAPNHFASARLYWDTSMAAPNCAYGRHTDVTAPNTTRTVRLSIRPSLCDVRVDAVKRGTDYENPFAYAQVNWLRGSHASSAREGHFWSRAATSLNKRSIDYRSNDYATQIRQLREFVSLPNTGLTKKQMREYRRDVTSLDIFFSTPGLYK